MISDIPLPFNLLIGRNTGAVIPMDTAMDKVMFMKL